MPQTSGSQSRFEPIRAGGRRRGRDRCGAKPSGAYARGVLGNPSVAPSVHPRSAPPQSDDSRQITSTRFRPDVEGLRAIAIAAVVGYHVGLPFVPGGFVGVDIFFVISGFLITGLLVREVQTTGRISLARFWARRARRLLPAATLVLAVVGVLAFLLIPALDHQAVGFDLVAAAFYVSNIRSAIQATDYLAADSSPSPVLHFWSLGVEEQFYLFWPVLILVIAVVVALLRRRSAATVAPRGTSTGHIAAVLVVLGVASFVLSLRLTERIEPWAFFVMPTRAWEFAVGGLLSVGTVSIARLPPVVRSVTGLVGFVVLIGSVGLINSDVAYPGTAALWPVLATGAIIAAGAAPAARPVGVPLLLSSWPLRALGRLSYSWYLWHWPALVLASSALGVLSVPARLLIALLALVPAALAYRFVERPLHHHPALVSDTRKSLWLGGALSCSAALVGLVLVGLPGGGAFANGTPAPSSADEQVGRGPASTAPPVSAKPSDKPSAGAASPGSPSSGAAVDWPTGALTPAPSSARADLPVIYSDGCHLSQRSVTYPPCHFGDSSSVVVVLFGDSHAAQWFPTLQTLAKQHHWLLISRTKSGCPAPDVTIFQRGLKRAYDECDTWRRAVLAELTGPHRPTLVVAAGTRTDSLVDRATGNRMTASTAGAEWQAGWTRTLAQFATAGVHVAVLRDTPWPGVDIPACVARHMSTPSACDVARDALDSPAYDVGMTARSTTAHGVDLTKILCDSDRCPATRGKYLVYRDTSHLTATFARALAPYLGRALLPLLG